MPADDDPLYQRLLVGAGFADQDFVFCEPDGSPLRPERVYQAFKRRVRKHACPYLSPHGLRHTWATIALANGVHPRVVQERLGHAHLPITLQTYSHVQPTMHDDAAALVANLLLRERWRLDGRSCCEPLSRLPLVSSARNVELGTRRWAPAE